MDSNQENNKKVLYNIVTVVTFDYFPFFLVFLNSLFSNTNHELIGSIYVITDKLPLEFVNYLNQFEKIIIISDHDTLKFTGAHGEGWKKAVEKKLSACRSILQKDPLPLLLIDSDTVFLGDISHYIRDEYDVLVTYITIPEERHVRRDGLKINFIGSVVIFIKTQASLFFIEKWISKIDYVSRNFSPPHETPSLNLILEEKNTLEETNIGVINDVHICADQNAYEGTKVIHLKSWGPSNANPIKNFIDRISYREWTSEHTPSNYLDALCYERWLMYQLGYITKNEAKV